MKCILSSCIENSGAMTLKGSTCTCTAQIALRSSTFEDPATRFPMQLTENPKFYFKVSQLTNSSNSTLSPTHRAAGGVKRGGAKVVLIEVFLDDTYSTSVCQNNFFQVRLNQDYWLPWYYFSRKQSLRGRFSCWVRRPLGLWNANKERASRLD